MKTNASTDRMIDLLTDLSEFLEPYVDVVDGSYGEYAPNKAMSLQQDISDAIYRLKRSDGPKQPALDALMGVLDELEDYLEQRQDIKDGGDGTPRPNEEMSLLSDLQWWRSAAGLSSATNSPAREKEE